MEKQKYGNVPHYELIKENKTIIIPSVFMFKGGHLELYPFLQKCKELNCSVYFQNEELLIEPQSESETNMRLLIYLSIASNSKIGDDYLRYLNNIDEMTWENVESSQIKEMNISDAIRQVMKKKNVTLQSMATSLGKNRANDVSSRLANKNLTTSSALEMLDVLGYELIIQEKRQDTRREDQIVITFEEENQRTNKTLKQEE